MNIVLIGYRGTGKSVVARHLAEQLGMESVSMDEDIVRRAGMGVPEIVAQHGWPHFRDIESEAARDFGARDNLVIDTGGGVIERPENIEALKQNGTVVWLVATIETVIQRISDGTERPALTEGKSFTDEVAEVLERRTPIYAAAADYQVPTPTGDGTSLAVAKAVLDVLERTGGEGEI